MWLGGKTFSEQQLRWSDQWATAAMSRISTKISLTGKTIIYAQNQIGGRPITLEGWMTQDELQDIQELYGAAGQDYTLIFDSGRQFNNVVILSVESSAVLNKSNPNWIKVIVKMMTVAA